MHIIIPFLLCFVVPLSVGSKDFWSTLQNGIDKFLQDLNTPEGQRLLQMVRSLDIASLTKEIQSPEGQRFMRGLDSPEGRRFVHELNSPVAQRYLKGLNTPENRRIMRCTLPPYPKNARYVIEELPNGRPGDVTEFATFDVICDDGYMVASRRTRYFCIFGYYGLTMPSECVPRCQLDLNSESVEYSDCIFPGSRNASQCTAEVPAGTTVRTSKCRQADYFSTKQLPEMNCVDGEWDVHNAFSCRLGTAISFRCKNLTASTDCGRVTPRTLQLVVNGTSVKRGDLPWHVGVYRKTAAIHKNICGGTIVKTDVVISAAHCFWDDFAKKSNPATEYTVAAGKIYAPWSDTHDSDAQKSEIKSIYTHESFYGAENNYANDIALLFLMTPFHYVPYIKPVCLNFGRNFENSDLIKGKLGTVAGWGYTSADGKRSGVLKTTQLPFVPERECMDRAPDNFKQLIVYDKICAGSDAGISTLCQGDSGGGLVFPREVFGERRYYLHGIVSTSPSAADSSVCNVHAIVTFTRLSAHKNMIRERLLVAGN